MFREELIMSVQSKDIVYRHRQSPLWFILMIFLLILIMPLLIVILTRVTKDSDSVVAYISAGFLIPFGLILWGLFYGLTIEVNRDIVRLYFGFGIIHRSIPREHITAVTQVRNRLWWGFGIRLTPHGWMWNISGLDAVELTYHNGKKFRIGTDEPEALLEALKVV